MQGQQEFVRGPESISTEVASTSYSSNETEARSTGNATAYLEWRNNVDLQTERFGEDSSTAVPILAGRLFTLGDCTRIAFAAMIR